MNRFISRGVGLAGAALATVALTAATYSTAAASERPTIALGADHVVFVQTNDLAANSVVALDRANDGRLTRAGTYLTGGKGGSEDQAPVDSLASQGSLTYDARHGLLYAVNAGSDSVTVFAVSGDRLERRQIVSSGGQFPVSVATYGNLVFVLNAGGDGSISGYRLEHGRLTSQPGAHRSLGLGNANTPLFISAPAQIGFDPTGRHVLVTTKNHDTIEVWNVRSDGSITGHATNDSAGAVPFAFDFDRFGHLAVTEAGASTVTTYQIHRDGTLETLTPTIPDGGAALCWVVDARGLLFGANAGSNSISSYRTGPHGELELVQAIATTTDGGPIDMATAAGGRYVYVQASVAGEVQGFQVERDGTLTPITTITGLPAFAGHGMEGLVAV
jgi:6-phosphogluconolactonase (cycloisomerase 2 family)